ncbi:hypothetical protein E1890_22890 [Salmonella enterica subsp. enterica serovar Mountpleasant]|nr:hypothetical protein [Salmonella enterica subsp. enterica serovar Mountpleasant]
MPKPRWSIEQKKHHVAAWRASGLTRQQYFNKNMTAYIDYKINLLKENNPAGIDTHNIVATGLVYQF